MFRRILHATISHEGERREKIVTNSKIQHDARLEHVERSGERGSHAAREATADGSLVRVQRSMERFC